MKYVLSGNKFVKAAFAAMLVIQTYAAQRVFADSSDRDKATKWIQNELREHRNGDFLGQTSDGKPCGLYLTDIHQGRYNYFVVVGLQETNDANEYIGITTTPEASIKVTDQQLAFFLNQSWGNDSVKNTVVINLNEKGSPTQAIGVSDINTIVCNISSEVKGR